MAQQYSLKWNNHQPNFISMFAMLRNTQALVDVTLAAEGRHLHAHKMVLSACSPYFHSLFMENPSRHPIVILKDVSFNDLRTIVDFMYYGEVNITQEELPQMLHSAKSLKVKGLTETESTSVMRSHSSEFPFEAPGESSGDKPGEPSGEQTGEQRVLPSEQHNNQGDHDTHKRGSSPTNSPSTKRRRRRRSSNGSTSINMVGEDQPNDGQMEIGREGVTLSSVPRRREFPHDDNSAGQQNSEPQNISIEDLHVDHNASGMPQGGQWSMMDSYPRYTNSCFGGNALGGEGGGGGGGAVGGGGMYMGGMMQLEELMSGLRLRRTKHLKRQPAVEERVARRQVSEPAAPMMLPPTPSPTLRKHNSYPLYAPRNRRPRSVLPVSSGEQEVGALLIRAVSVTSRRSPIPATRASHTPAVRSGPPLSCNYCWNTVDETGRILRRKTQYHCPECRTNLCIVPCFHEYHEADVANAR